MTHRHDVGTRVRTHSLQKADMNNLPATITSHEGQLSIGPLYGVTVDHPEGPRLLGLTEDFFHPEAQ